MDRIGRHLGGIGRRIARVRNRERTRSPARRAERRRGSTHAIGTRLIRGLGQRIGQIRQGIRSRRDRISTRRRSQIDDHHAQRIQRQRFHQESSVERCRVYQEHLREQQRMRQEQQLLEQERREEQMRLQEEQRRQAEFERQARIENNLSTAESALISCDYDRAVHYFNEVLKDNPTHSLALTKKNEAIVGQGDSCAKKGDYLGALKHYMEAKAAPLKIGNLTKQLVAEQIERIGEADKMDRNSIESLDLAYARYNQAFGKLNEMSSILRKNMDDVLRLVGVLWNRKNLEEKMREVQIQKIRLKARNEKKENDGKFEKLQNDCEFAKFSLENITAFLTRLKQIRSYYGRITGQDRTLVKEIPILMMDSIQTRLEVEKKSLTILNLKERISTGHDRTLNLTAGQLGAEIALSSEIIERCKELDELEPFINFENSFKSINCQEGERLKYLNKSKRLLGRLEELLIDDPCQNAVRKMVRNAVMRNIENHSTLRRDLKELFIDEAIKNTFITLSDTGIEYVQGRIENWLETMLQRGTCCGCFSSSSFELVDYTPLKKTELVLWMGVAEKREIPSQASSSLLTSSSSI